jgi:hypothetical protein
MNLAQIRSDVRDRLTAGGGLNTVISVDTFWSNSEIDSYINVAQAELYKVIRRARADYFTRIMVSTDAPLLILGQLFDPASLRWVAGQGNYQLPPDFVRMKLMTDQSSERVRFMASDIAKNEFKVLMNQEGGSTAREYLYDILGVRTLLFRPKPAEVRDIEFVYEKRLARLKDWSTGTVDVLNGNTTVTFSASADIQNRVQVGNELVVGTSSTIAPIADPTETYPVIKSIDSATQVTLESPYLGPNATGMTYIASPVSEIPEHHHDLIMAWATMIGFKKGTNPHIDAVKQWEDVYNHMLPTLIADVEVRQGSDPETVTAYLEDLYDA